MSLMRAFVGDSNILDGKGTGFERIQRLNMVQLHGGIRWNRKSILKVRGGS